MEFVTKVIRIKVAIQPNADGTLATVNSAPLIVKCYIGPLASLGNGLCEASCNSPLCDYDGGDCFTRENPYTRYVTSKPGSNADGSWLNPYVSFHQSLSDLWAPYTRIYLLAGTHLLGIASNIASILVLELSIKYVSLQTLLCSGTGDHPQCATGPATVQFTKSSVTVGVNFEFYVRNVDFIGGFSLKSGCSKVSCTYCPSVHLNLTTRFMNDDRNQNISTSNYAEQSLCDFYQNSALIQMRPNSTLLMENVRFINIKHQLKALILNECGELRLRNVTFSDVMTRRLGLKGGIITQIVNSEFEPYYCGSFSFMDGLVELINNGYEYSSTGYYSGFLYLDALRLINITNVVFRNNYCMVGRLQQVYGSSLMYLQRFREFHLNGCRFTFNLVDTGAAFYINSALDIPLAIANRLAGEHMLQHILIENNLFVNNTGRRGSVIYIQFLKDHQNVLMRNNTFINNFAQDVGVVDINNAYLLPAFEVGETIPILYEGELIDVFIPPVTMIWDNMHFISNYAPYTTFVTNVANFLLTNVDYRDNGKSLSGINFSKYVVEGYSSLVETYMKLIPPNIIQGECAGTFLIENPYNVTASNIVFDASICTKGFPGMTVRGDTRNVITKQINISHLEFKNSIGSGMLALTVSLDLTLSDLIFRNNSNTEDQLSVCINIKQTKPTNCVIKDTIFIGNKAVFSTLASITGAKSLTLHNIKAENNVAISTSAGVIYTPLVNEDSFVTVEDCVFHNNSALRSGMIFVTEETGNMLNGLCHVTIAISNTTFSNNKSNDNGCSVTITGFIMLSETSHINGSKFLGNICGEGGAGLFVTYLAGVILVEDSIFSGNTGTIGTAIYSTHQGTVNRETHLDMRNCVFTNNTGSSIVQISGKNNPLFITENNVFSNNSGSCVTILSAVWLDSSSLYSDNVAYEGAVFGAFDYTVLTLSNFTARRNVASIKGGVGSVSTHSIVQCTNCLFASNTCEEIGGVISIDLKSNFNCTNCEFTRNVAVEKGSVIYALFSMISITSSTIRDNNAKEYGTLSLTESSGFLSDSELSGNSASIRSPGIIASLSNVTVLRCNFSNQEGETGAFFFTAVSNIIVIEDSVLSKCKATYGGAFYSMIFSTFLIRRTEIKECTAESEGSIAQVRDSVFLLEGVSLSKATAVFSNGAFYLVQSLLNVSSSDFRDMHGNAIIAQTSTLNIENSLFEGITAVYGSAVSCIDCYLLSISHCVLRNNLAQKGGAVYSFTTGLMLTKLVSVYINNTFVNNKAVNGGAIYSESVHIEMQGNIFVNNSANSAFYLFDGLLKKRGEGGALYTVCEYILFCAVSIINNKFEGNSAEMKGGAIYWFDSFPIISKNEMKNNFAIYGNDIASFPIKLVLISDDNKISEYLSNASIPLASSISDVASGHLSTEIRKFGLVDHYGHIVSIDNTSGAQIFTDDSVLNIGGTTQVLAKSGIFTFSQLIFKGKPLTTQTFTITTTGVDETLKILSNDQNVYYPSVNVEVHFRDCLKGESLQGIECYTCPKGTYSLDPSHPCSSCPDHATCFGNFTMSPDPGYWRPDPFLDIFFPCPFVDACLGSPSNGSIVSLTGLCDRGYQGNLCSNCEFGYSRQGKYECGKCPNLASNIAISFLIIGFALLLGLLIVFVAIRGAAKPRSEIALYLKIFMNYLQMVVVATSLNLNWPGFVSVFLSGQETAGSVTEQLFSFDCIMQELSMTKVYYTKVLANALLPVALMIFAMSIWLMIHVCFRVGELMQKLIATLVLIIFIVHPGISKVMFSLFSCMELKPGELWLISDLSLKCWDSTHVTNILSVSVPSIVIWILGLPAICMGWLYSHRGILFSDHNTQLKFSFLYKGYHPRWYLWEFVILYRKVAVICACVFLSNVSIMVQALSVLAVLLVSLFFQLQVKPFMTANFNSLELRSILVSAVTIYSGLFYQTESISKVYAAFEVKILLFIIMLGINVYFLFSWAKSIVPLIVGTLRRRFGRVIDTYTNRTHISSKNSRHSINAAAPRSIPQLFNLSEVLAS